MSASDKTKSDRGKRLSSALRANLRRRKEQARDRRDGDGQSDKSEHTDADLKK